MGVGALPIIAVPVDVRVNVELAEKAAADAIDEIVRILTDSSQKTAEKYRDMHSGAELERKLGRPAPVVSWEAIEGPDSLEEANAFFYDRGWTDGLPIIPPSEAAVKRMLSYTDRDPKEVIGKIPPRWGRATVERVAINAVMAGCLPQHLPLVLCATDILARPEFEIFSAQATTNPVAPMMLVNGPLARELQVNGSFNLLGPGWRSNASMGRAVRFVLVNIGGGVPGTTDKSIHGQPAKYTFCIAENEEETPWEPFHVERGFDRNVSTVTMVGAQAIHNVIVLDNRPQSTLEIAADAMCTVGVNTMYYGGRPTVVINPRLANYLARVGYSKNDVKKHLFDHARVPLSRFPVGTLPQLMQRRAHLDFSSPDSMIPVCDKPADINILVAGGGGTHVLYLPAFSGHCLPTTVPIALKDGTPVRSIEEFLTR
ncbi:MAG: hypothetical protein HYX92_18270 [Chloroflexi bacterium]|nr:hypothetical protein [Chloroflexota bacterium]